MDPLNHPIMHRKIAIGEVAWLWRHRAKLSASQAAEARGLTRMAWSELEREWAYEGGCSLVTGWLDSPVTASDRLRLLRRRAHVLKGIGRQELADHTKISHVTYLKWERATDPRLVTWWATHGYNLLQLP